jgi:hypothetical protein
MNDTNHAVQNANGWADSIRSLVAALECDFDRLEKLRDERAELAATVKEAEDAQQEKDRHAAQVALNEWDAAYAEELRELTDAATVDGDLMADADAVRERIQESPLSVEVRSGWCASKADMAPEEFQILLSTGGPALRIMGELDEHGQPSRAWLEYQDWGTPWTHHYVEGLADALLTFAQQFYFGE